MIVRPDLRIGPAPGRLLLSPRAFHSCINPYKHARALADSLIRAERDFFDYLDFSDYLNAKTQARPPSGVCFGLFWDANKMQQVRVFLGNVTIRPKFPYDPASPFAALAQAVSLSRVGAGPYVNFSTGAERPERSEDAPQSGENSPGPYVIPGQSLTGETKHTKTGGQNLTGEIFEWSAEKCESETC